MRSPDPKHVVNVIARLDGAPLEGVARDEAILLLHALALADRITITTLEGEPLQIADVNGLDEAVEHFGSSGLPRGTVRAAAHALASLAAGRRRAAARPPRPEAPPPSPSEVALATSADLRRLEHAAELALERARERRERHAQLVAAGDLVAAAEVADDAAEIEAP